MSVIAVKHDCRLALWFSLSLYICSISLTVLKGSRTQSSDIKIHDRQISLHKAIK